MRRLATDAPGYRRDLGDCALQLMSEGAMSKLEFAAALRIFAGGRAGLHGGRREAALYMEGIGEA